jgi:glucosamine kinase
MKKEKNYYVVGVDAGGTETVAALANLKGEILKIGKAGPANPRNVGIKETGKNIALAIRQVLKKNKRILAICIGLPAFSEEYQDREEEIKETIIQSKKISSNLKAKIFLQSDQVVAFRAAVKQKNGILLIAGTGCVARGWRGEEEIKVGGWGWLADEGSAFWAGKETFRAILKNLDGRGEKTFLTEIIFKQFDFKNTKDLLKKVYSQNFTQIIPRFSILCDLAAKKRDRVAKKIFIQAARELVLTAKTVIKRLGFQKEEFPLVLVGGMFKSKLILNFFKKEIKKFAKKTKFIYLKRKPVKGAIRLAIEKINASGYSFNPRKPKENS